MAARPAPASRGQGWAGLLVGLALFVAVPVIAPLRALLPIEHTLLLLLPAVGACFVTGWWIGGGITPLLGATAAAALALTVVGRSLPPDYRDVARAWGLLSAGVFGVVCVMGARTRGFLPRSLTAVGLLALLALVIVTAQGVPLTGLRDQVAGALAGRNAAAVLGVPGRVQPVSEWLHLPTDASRLWAANYAQFLRHLSAAALPLYAAAMGLEIVAALALAWALYHRLSRTPIGPPLTPFQWFSFSGQLAWGMAAGLALAFVPTLSPLAPLGLNLVGFFGALFCLRGLAVIVWFASHWYRAATVLLALVWLSALSVAAFAVVELTVALCLVLGLADVVVNWRELAQATRRPAGERPAL